MVEEYHDQFLHVMVDCKTGDPGTDKAVEHMMIGYANLVMYCVKTNKLSILIDKMEDLAKSFRK